MDCDESYIKELTKLLLQQLIWLISFLITPPWLNPIKSEDKIISELFYIFFSLSNGRLTAKIWCLFFFNFKIFLVAGYNRIRIYAFIGETKITQKKSTFSFIPFFFKFKNAILTLHFFTYIFFTKNSNKYINYPIFLMINTCKDEIIWKKKFFLKDLYELTPDLF